MLHTPKRLVGALILSGVLLAGCSSTPDSTPHNTDTASLASLNTATIQTFERRPSDCISPISVIRINDRNLTTGLQQFALPPGTYTIRGRAIITGNFCRNMSVASGGGNLDPLEIEVEAGKIYSIGVNHRATSSRQWFLEVWQVQDKRPAE